MIAPHDRPIPYFASERYQMMLTQGKHINVLDNDHFIMILMKNGIVNQI